MPHPVDSSVWLLKFVSVYAVILKSMLLFIYKYVYAAGGALYAAGGVVSSF